MNEPYVNYHIKNSVATIEFFHPKSNSFPSSQLKKLTNLFYDLGENDSVKLIVLKSLGEKVFCAGASFDELLKIDNFETGKHFFLGFATVLMAMRDCPKFIVASVEGKVVGGGVGLVAASDYVVARENAQIKLSELSIGIGPFVIEPAITRKIGLNAFSELTLNPKIWKDASWCKEKGLYNSVCDEIEYQTTLDSFTQELSHYSKDAMKLLKEVLWEGTEAWEEIMPRRAAMSGELVLSDFAKSTLKRFKS